MGKTKASGNVGTEGSLGWRLRDTRERQRGMSAVQLHKLTKISKSSITRFENGERQPRAAELIKLCSALSVSPTYLLYGDEAPEFGVLSTAIYDREIKSDQQLATVAAALVLMMPRPDKTAVLQLMMSIVAGRIGAEEFTKLADFVFQAGDIAARKLTDPDDKTILQFESDLELDLERLSKLFL